MRISDWSADVCSSDLRGKLLVLADAVRANADGLARMLVREQGKPLPEARVEVAFTEGLIRYFASIDVPVEIIQDDETHRIEVHRKEIGRASCRERVCTYV